MRLSKWWLILLILFGFALRVHGLDAQSLWADEGLSALRVSYDVPKIWANELDIQEFVSKDKQPPLYFLVVHATTQLIGNSDFSLRIPSVWWGVLLIPLLFRYGNSLFSNRLGKRVGSIVALLTAINPLQIWYAQEARMYTQLVFLGALSSFTLWQLLKPNTKHLSYFNLYTSYFLSTALAFYTHYTMAFLIMVQGVFWLYHLWQRRLRWVLGLLALAGAIVTIPLAPLMFKHLTGPAEASYSLIPPHIMFLDVVRGFGFGKAVRWEWPVMWLFAAGLTGLLLWGAWRGRTLRALWLISYLLAAVFGTMAGSYLIQPMYQGIRHVMVGSPAFLLLIAAGLASPFLWGGLRGRLWRGVLLVTVIITQLLPLWWARTYPDYAKEDYRGMVAWIEENAGQNDLMLYNNALLLPLHEHYQTRDDLLVTAQPIYPITASADTITETRALLSPYDRVFFMPELPQDRRDDNEMIRQLMREHIQLQSQSFAGNNTIMQIRVYDLGAVNYAQLPDDAHHIDPVENGSLVGMTWDDNHETLSLFWDDAPTADQTVTFNWVDPSGNTHETHTLPVWFNYAPHTQTDDMMIRTAYHMPIPAGTVGNYQLHITHNQQTATVDVPITAENYHHISSPTPHTAFHHSSFIIHTSIHGLETATRPGNPLPITLYWHSETDVDLPLTWQLDVMRDGDVLRSDTGIVGAEWLNVLPAGLTIAQPIGIYPRPEWQPGTYQLRWSVAGSEAQQMGEMIVEPFPIITDLPDNVPVRTEKLGNVALDGATVSERDNNHVDVTLYWRSLGEINDHHVFVHLAADPSAQPVAQSNNAPAGGSRPTTGWRTGELIADTHQLRVPDELEAGTYTIYVGLYEPVGFGRLPVTLDGEPQLHNQITVDQIIITK